MVVFSLDRNSVNYERYPAEYFSGTNVHIFFGDIYIDEITTLQFSLQEQVMPVYGYNSYTWDDTFRGNRIIQGMFRINFKQVDYIREAVRSIMGDGQFQHEDNFPDWSTEEDMEEKINQLYNVAEEGWSKQFEKISEDFKKQLWRTADPGNVTGLDGDTPYFDFEDNFNILIKYGPFDQPKPMYKNEQLHRRKVSGGTIIKIKDVQIQAVQQNVDSSGQPVSEDYTFMAKDMSRGHEAEERRNSIHPNDRIK